jgi:hypothetical protein
LPSADSAVARQKGQLKAYTVGSLTPIIDSRLTESLMGGMCIDPRPRDLLMGTMRIHPRLGDALMCRIGINPHLSDSLMGRMRLLYYAIVPWQVQHLFLFLFFWKRNSTFQWDCRLQILFFMKSKDSNAEFLKK